MMISPRLRVVASQLGQPLRLFRRLLSPPCVSLLSFAATRAASVAAHAPPPSFPSSEPYRTHTCHSVSAAPPGSNVVLVGWVKHVREMGGLLFITLRDSYGLVQLSTQDAALIASLVRPGAAPRSSGGAASVDAGAVLRPESILSIVGVVRERPAARHNPGMSSGHMEIEIKSARVLATPPPGALPIQVSSAFGGGGGSEVIGEDVRLEHRLLDLRRAVMQRNIRLRSAVTHAMRNFLHGACEPPFTEIETPTLFRSTPEGAREFLVPTRQRGRAFALIQSPQQHKQMLMVGGFDRYFQIARCYRDESGRADRQPEFTQLDIEMGFAGGAQVRSVVEGVVATAFRAAGALAPAADGSGPALSLDSAAGAPRDTVFGHLGRHADYMVNLSTPASTAADGLASSQKSASAPSAGHEAPRNLIPWSTPALPLPIVTYAHAMATYGTDKPDRRLGMPICEVSHLLVGAFAAPAEARVPAATRVPATNALPPNMEPGQVSASTILAHFREATEGINCPGAAPTAAKRTLSDDSSLEQFLPTAHSVRAFVVPRNVVQQFPRKAFSALLAASVATSPAAATAGSGGGAAIVDVAWLRVREKEGAAAEGHLLAPLPDSPHVPTSVALTKALPQADNAALASALGAAVGDAVVVVAGPSEIACKTLGAIRLAIGRAAAAAPPVSETKKTPAPKAAAAAPPPSSVRAPDLFWVVDFPLFSVRANDDSERPSPTTPSFSLESTHHPFTAPAQADALALRLAMAEMHTPVANHINGGLAGGVSSSEREEAPPIAPSLDSAAARQLLTLRGAHYDLVCDGVELGGGSERISCPRLQRDVLVGALRVPPHAMRGFEPLLAALGLGAPPHAGAALGLDRLIMLLVGSHAASSVRDVIAFPKSATGNDLLIGAPAEVAAEGFAEYHLRVI